MIEIWKYIPEYNNQYQVSNFGRIKSFKGRVERILKPRTHTNGYLRVYLSNEVSRKDCYIHRLVMLVFNSESSMEVNHKDGDKTNNHISNLEYCTRQHNLIHALKTGLRKMPNIDGENNGRSKLTTKDVIEIKRRLRNDETCVKISEDYPVKEGAIKNIKTGKSWSHIDG